MEQLVLMVVRDTLLVVVEEVKLPQVMVDLVEVVDLKVVLALLTLAVVEDLATMDQAVVLVVVVLLLSDIKSKYLKKS
jgi:hypothetical protein